MPKPVHATEAADRYDKLGRGTWRADSLPGICLAAQHEIARELVHAIELERRRREGLRADADRPPPPWVIEALPDCFDVAVQMRQTTGLLSTLLEPASLARVIELCRSGSIATWHRRLSGEERALFEREAAHVIGDAPAQRSALQMFFYGTRWHYVLSGWGEPTPGEVRLLAAARGLEPITRGLDRARKVWEDRIRRWKSPDDALSLLASSLK